MKKQQLFRSVLSGVILTALLFAVPMLLVSTEQMPMADTSPTLSFEGMRISVAADGSIQAFVDVWQKNLPFTTGASFRLTYNDKYLEPSRYDTNAQFDSQGAVESGDFFQHNTELLVGGSNPFSLQAPVYVSSGSTMKYAVVDRAMQAVSMTMWLNQAGTGNPVGDDNGTYTRVIAGNMPVGLPGNAVLFRSGNMYRLSISGQPSDGRPSGSTGVEYGNTYRYFFAMPPEGVKLGTLSFRVDPDHVQEMVAAFAEHDTVDGIELNGEHLLKFAGDSPATVTWSQVYYNIAEFVQFTSLQPVVQGRNATTNFKYSFDKSLVKAEALKKEITLNAYQAFTNGTVADIRELLQIYSPMMVATFADGSVENKIIGWGDSSLGYSVTNLDGTEVTAYDPKVGSYIASQYYEYIDQNGLPVRHPNKIQVVVNVTPVTVVDVKAEKLDMTIGMNAANISKYSSVDRLELPREANLITDVVVATSLVVDLPMWVPSPTDITGLTPSDNDESDAHWPSVIDYSNNPSDALRLGRGTYPFFLDDVTNPTKIDSTMINSRYPWLTVGQEFGLPASRKLVGESELYDDLLYVTSISSRDSGTLVSDAPFTDDGLTLTLNIHRLTALGSTSISPMDATSLFRLYTPDGQEILTNDVSDGVTWFGGTDITDNASYVKSRFTIETYTDYGYTLTIMPGISDNGADDTPPYGDYFAQREALRRKINLGGWFYVTVKEGDREWSNLLPVYLEPRQNDYTENKEYNFVGLNRGLFPHIAPLPTRVTMPDGLYRPYDSYAHTLGAEERYAVRTTYDFSTGGQPGYTSTFEVEPDWTTSQITDFEPAHDVYGANDYKNGTWFTAYGELFNRYSQNATMIFETDRVQPEPREQIKIYRKEDDPRISIHADDTVDTARFDSRQIGYTTRQEYTLVIKNTGDTDIHGMYIDVEQMFRDSGGHYQIINPPAAFLPAGGSTTFTITYDYGLEPNDGQPYLDRIFVGSNNTQVVVDEDTPANDSYLGYFDARFTVTRNPVGRITIVVRPPLGIAGERVAEANIITGETADDGTMPEGVSAGTPVYVGISPTAVVMDYSIGSATQETDKPVFISVEPLDEYEIKEVFYYSQNGENISLTGYRGAGNGSGPGNAALMDGTNVYVTSMPDRDLVIYVDMYEPITSKLRLGDLKVYASENDDLILDPLPDDGGAKFDPDKEIPIWRKSFTQAERDDAADDGDTLVYTGRSSGVQGFVSTHNQYLSVIPYEAEYVSLEALLREVVWLSENVDFYNAGIDVDVTMYASDLSNPELYELIMSSTGGATNPAARFFSNVFAAPSPGASRYTKIEIRPQSDPSTVRVYYVEIVRPEREISYELNYGNSPFGLIMNQPDDAYVGTYPHADDVLNGRNAAKQRFIDNGYRFDMSAATDTLDFTPKAARDKNLSNTYNREAWVPLERGYSPETGAALSLYRASGSDSYDDVAAQNLDLNDYAYFITIGSAAQEPKLSKAVDNSMRDIPPEEIHRWVEVIALTEGEGQDKTFAGVDTTGLTTYAQYIGAYRAAGRTYMVDLGVMSNEIPSDWAGKGYKVTGTNGDGTPIFTTDKPTDATDDDESATEPVEPEAIIIRPGIYELIYEFLDYDASTRLQVSRPLVIVSNPGDVDLDGLHSKLDRNTILQRITRPLGIDAPHYDAGYSNSDSVYKATHAAVYRYRCVDANNDRNVNNIDANQVGNSSAGIVTYYPATDYVYRVQP